MPNDVARSDAQVQFRENQQIARAGDRPSCIYQITEGWAYAYRILRDGRRQIGALYLPGDICAPQWIFSGTVSQTVAAITPVKVTVLACAGAVLRSTELHERLCLSMAEVSERQANWLLVLGRGCAMERVAWLLVELYERLGNARLTYGRECFMPLTQTDLADLTGLTSVHVNRTLQSMRARGLIKLRSKWLSILDMAALRRLANFSMFEPAPQTERGEVQRGQSASQ